MVTNTNKRRRAFDRVSLYNTDTSAAGRLRGLWNLLAYANVRIEALCFHAEPHMPQPEYTMNIFYIIGVVVVILFVAGFLGLR